MSLDKKLQEGLFIPIFFFLYKLLKKVNLVEILKNNMSNKNLAIDLFILLKWCFVLFIIILNIQSLFINIFLWILIAYLLCFNLFTYFDHHVLMYLKLDKINFNSKLKRFYNVTQSFLFSILCFGYFYLSYFSCCFSWQINYDRRLAALFISTSTSLFSTNYSKVQSISQSGDILVIIQMIHSFIFLSIIITATLNYNQNESHDLK